MIHQIKRTPLMLYLKLTLGLVVLLLTLSCIGKKNGKLLPAVPALITPYTPADLGITPPDAGTPLAVLPVISEKEREKITLMITDMEAMGMLTDAYWKSAGNAARKSLEFVPVSNAQLDAKIDSALNGTVYTPPKVPTKEELLKQNEIFADHFYAELASRLPELSDEKLIIYRHQQTLALVTNRMLQDYQNTDEGLPVEFILLSRRKIAAFRDLINEELVRRGVTNI
jgi:hypothetical protein